MDMPTLNESHFFDTQQPIFLASANASKPEHASILLVPSAKKLLPDHVCVGRLTAWLQDYM